MNSIELSEADRSSLLELVEDTVAYGLEAGSYRPVRTEDFPSRLRRRAASFVSLYLHGQVRGCIGNLRPSRPLVEDVAHNAYAAAFRDPRFEPVDWKEFLQLHIEISLLSPLQSLQFENEETLLEQLRPGVDGLVLEAGSYRATFLPKVWEHFPGRQAFVHQLKSKAGLAADYWSETINIQRYTAHTFSSLKTGDV